ncbi:MAG: hypothetical protein H5T50_10055, partial [Nitrososphaeria archaeon]|nr:hypothetical protein [Nitrososphaeria archaeon]
KKLKQGKEAEYKIECSEGHIALNYIHPRPIIPKNEPKTMFETASLHTELKVSTGISKHRATAQKGMIYEYEVIIGNQEFWAFLGVSDKLSEHINKGLEIRIGRGISRGHGLSKITEVKEIHFDEISDKIKEQIDEEMILYGFTPLLGSVSYTKYFPYPEEIDLNEMMKMYGFNSGEYGKITIKRVYGRTRELSCGWDMIKNVKRPSFKEIACEGSIVIAKLEEKANTSNALALLSTIGFPVKFEDYIVSGINVILPLKMCPIGGN